MAITLFPYIIMREVNNLDQFKSILIDLCLWEITFTFHCLNHKLSIFHDFPRLENGITTFHDFPKMYIWAKFAGVMA